ncbi:conserved hypothetical protein [Candidatus Moduliflexus flocculans]|uniref:Uncharacterized protein n=1 Tax=Candidatus Moduliflexus flocculans TaxID=1499966 RepID=A0A0S6VQ72_9BACT|nr:conserved hypothetical protein [Candidatus Moduliflexus flocculans]
MRTEEIGIFENETACDWLYKLEDREDLSLVMDSLDNVLDVEDDYLEAFEAEEGLAAAETVARLKGEWGMRDASTEIVDKWVEEYKITPTKNLIKKSLAVVARIQKAPSELLELQKDGKKFDEWKNVLDDLTERLKR